MVSAEGTRLAGPLRISTPLSFGLRYLGPVVAEVARAQPGVHLEVDLSDREVDLVDQRFDLAVRIGKLTDSSLVAKRLTMIDMVCVASPAYLAEHGWPETPETPEALGEHKALRYILVKRTTIWRFTDENGRIHQARPQFSQAGAYGT